MWIMAFVSFMFFFSLWVIHFLPFLGRSYIFLADFRFSRNYFLTRFSLVGAENERADAGRTSLS